jgi:hypothetical protein
VALAQAHSLRRKVLREVAFLYKKRQKIAPSKRHFRRPFITQRGSDMPPSISNRNLHLLEKPVKPFFHVSFSKKSRSQFGWHQKLKVQHILPLHAPSQKRGYDGQTQAPAFVPFVTGLKCCVGESFSKTREKSATLTVSARSNSHFHILISSVYLFHRSPVFKALHDIRV